MPAIEEICGECGTEYGDHSELRNQCPVIQKKFGSWAETKFIPRENKARQKVWDQYAASALSNGSFHPANDRPCDLAAYAALTADSLMREREERFGRLF